MKIKNTNRRTVPFRRKRTGKTNYRKRLAMLKGDMPRLVIRRSLKHISAQIIEYHPIGDKVIISAVSAELKKHGWKLDNSNLPAAYLVGFLLAQKAKSKKLGDIIVDLGLEPSIHKSRIYAAIKGAVDGGLKVLHSPDVFPDENRIKGKHIADYALVLKKDTAKYNKQFSQYIKQGVNPENSVKHFEEVKKQISAIKA